MRGGPRSHAGREPRARRPLPSEPFDCIVSTHIPHFFIEPAVGQRVREMLESDGVLLINVPGNYTDRARAGDWKMSRCGRSPALSARSLSERRFPDGAVSVAAHEPKCQELEHLEHKDPRYPVSIPVRVVKNGVPA